VVAVRVHGAVVVLAKKLKGKLFRADTLRCQSLRSTNACSAVVVMCREQDKSISTSTLQVLGHLIENLPCCPFRRQILVPVVTLSEKVGKRCLGSWVIDRIRARLALATTTGIQVGVSVVSVDVLSGAEWSKHGWKADSMIRKLHGTGNHSLPLIITTYHFHCSLESHKSLSKSLTP
jgi:hypothetical protein